MYMFMSPKRIQGSLVYSILQHILTTRNGTIKNLINTFSKEHTQSRESKKRLYGSLDDFFVTKFGYLY